MKLTELGPADLDPLAAAVRRAACGLEQLRTAVEAFAPTVDRAAAAVRIRSPR